MKRLILFFAALAALMFMILYTKYTGQIIIVFGAEKLTMDLWFATILLVLTNLILWWGVRKVQSLSHLPVWFRSFRQRSLEKERQNAWQQAIMFALAGDHPQAVARLKHIDPERIADQVLLISWLNKTKHVDRLETALSKLGHDKRLSPKWLIWFRAHLLHEQGKQDLAVQLLLDAHKKGTTSSLIIRSIVQYANIKDHYMHLLPLEREIRKALPKENAVSCLSECFTKQLDQLIKVGDLGQFIHIVGHLPRDISKMPEMVYYQMQSLRYSEQDERLQQLMLSADLVADKRILPLLVDLDWGVEEKVMIVDHALSQNPQHHDLLYFRSYLSANMEDTADAVKLIEQAMRRSLLA